MQIENLLVKRPRTNQCRYTKLIKLCEGTLYLGKVEAVGINST